MTQPIFVSPGNRFSQSIESLPEKKMNRGCCWKFLNLFRKKVSSERVAEVPTLQERVIYLPEIVEEIKLDTDQKEDPDDEIRNAEPPFIRIKPKCSVLEATVGGITFRLGKQVLQDNLMFTKSDKMVIAFEKIVVRGRELKSIQFATDVADALSRARIDTNRYKSPRELSEAINQTIAKVVRKTMLIPSHIPLESFMKKSIDAVIKPESDSPSSTAQIEDRTPKSKTPRFYFI